MSTIQTTLKRAPTHRASSILTAAGALVAVAIAVLFLALAGGSSGHHAAISGPTPAYYPLIHYRGTGAPPASTDATRQSTPAPASSRKSYGAVS